MCSGVSGTIWGAGGNGGGIDDPLILLLLRGGAGVLLLEELRFLGFGDSCGTLLRLRFVVFVLIVFVLSLLAVVVLLVAAVVALIMVGSGARGRWTRGRDLGGRGGAKGSPPFLRSM